jgi:hypothetical protein
MTDTTTLDAAIKFADNSLCDFNGWPEHKFEVSEADRTYARALIAKLIEGMVEQDFDACCQFSVGWNAALTEIRRRAGLEANT